MNFSTGIVPYLPQIQRHNKKRLNDTHHVNIYTRKKRENNSKHTKCQQIQIYILWLWSSSMNVNRQLMNATCNKCVSNEFIFFECGQERWCLDRVMKAAELYLNYVYKYMNMFRVKFIQWNLKNDAEDASIFTFRWLLFPMPSQADASRTQSAHSNCRT